MHFCYGVHKITEVNKIHFIHYTEITTSKNKQYQISKGEHIMDSIQSKAYYIPQVNSEAVKQSAKNIIGKVLIYVPSVIIFGLIALYYIQLSHLGA